jgi:CBS domain-containing protein
MTFFAFFAMALRALRLRAFDRKVHKGFAKIAKKTCRGEQDMASAQCDKVMCSRGHRARLVIRKEPSMASVYDLVKDRRIYSIEAEKSVLEAARFMMEHNIGALPVMRNGELSGIVSERDIMNRVVAVGRMPGTTLVSEIMTANPKSISTDETVENGLFLMREFGFRHLPIVDGKQLKGLVSLRDLLLRYVAQKEAESRKAS